MPIVQKTGHASRWNAFLIGGLLLVVSGIYFAFDPAASAFFPPCPLKKFAGLDCPGCGSQRAFHALLHLQFGEAFRFNPLAIASIPLLVCDRLRGYPLLRHARAPGVVLAIVLAYAVLRNLSFYPY